MTVKQLLHIVQMDGAVYANKLRALREDYDQEVLRMGMPSQGDLRADAAFVAITDLVIEDCLMLLRDTLATIEGESIAEVPA